MAFLGRRKGGLYWQTKYSYRYCTTCNDGVAWIRLSKWAKDNHFTAAQCRKLLRVGYLYGRKYQGVMYCKVNLDSEYSPGTC